MHALRRLARRHRAFAATLFALALAAKLLLPAGYMPVLAGGHMTVSICSGSGPMTMVMPMPGSDRSDGEHGGEQGGDHKAQEPCAFAGLSAPSLAATDPLLLAGAIAFVLALGLFVVATGTVDAPPHLRPPLRGPPAYR